MSLGSLRLLPCLQLCNLDLNGTIHLGLQTSIEAQGEQYLIPHKHGSKKERLDQIIQQRGFPTLVFAVPDELGDPAHYVYDDSSIVHLRAMVVFGKVIR
jgi:hypothetical protein